MTLTLSVIGTGYLGAVHAACMAALGHRVIALDTDAAKIEALASGRAPLYEPGLDELLRDVLATGRLEFTTDKAAVAPADVHFVCVGTPQRAGGYAANTDYVFSAVADLAPHLKPGALVVGKSTVPAGTVFRLRDVLSAHVPDGVEPRLAWNPEFLRESFAIADTLHPDRFVYGVDGPHADADVALLDEVYEVPLSEGIPRLVTDVTTAELVKVSANAFLATKISFINAMAEMCEATGGDVVALAEALGYDERIGAKFLGSGVGFGGGCLPKDIRAFMARAEELEIGGALDFLRDVDAINDRRRARAVSLATAAVQGRDDAVITVLGAAFKPNSDDIRDSPALDVAEALADAGFSVRVHDPKALPVARQMREARETLTYVDDLDAALDGADVLLHLTEWTVYRELDPAEVASRVRTPHVIDGRNKLDLTAWAEAGFTVEALGRPRVGEAVGETNFGRASARAQERSEA